MGYKEGTRPVHLAQWALRTGGMSSLLVRRAAEVLPESRMSLNLRSCTEWSATHSRVMVDMLLSLSMYHVLPGCFRPSTIASILSTHTAGPLDSLACASDYFTLNEQVNCCIGACQGARRYAAQPLSWYRGPLNPLTLQSLFP